MGAKVRPDPERRTKTRRDQYAKIWRGGVWQPVTRARTTRSSKRLTIGL